MTKNEKIRLLKDDNWLSCYEACHICGKLLKELFSAWIGVNTVGVGESSGYQGINIAVVCNECQLEIQED